MTETLVPVFSALGDETRWSILQALGESDASASALAGRLPISRQAIAKHLAVLEDVGLVKPIRVGREVRYQVVGSELSAAARRLDAIGRPGRRASQPSRRSPKTYDPLPSGGWAAVAGPSAGPRNRPARIHPPRKEEKMVDIVHRIADRRTSHPRRPVQAIATRDGVGKWWIGSATGDDRGRHPGLRRRHQGQGRRAASP